MLYEECNVSICQLAEAEPLLLRDPENMFVVLRTSDSRTNNELRCPEQTRSIIAGTHASDTAAWGFILRAPRGLAKPIFDFGLPPAVLARPHNEPDALTSNKRLAHLHHPLSHPHPPFLSAHTPQSPSYTSHVPPR